MQKKYLISIVGSTAIGKTDLSITLAQHFDTDIISNDSRQFYKEMSIGTAVPSEIELKKVRHHFIQNRSIFQPYSVGDYERDAIKKLNDLFIKNNIVVMVGGSGLYVNAVLQGLDDFPDVDPEIRSQLNLELKNNGIRSLHKKLKKHDLTSYENIDIQNPQRVIRALEICIGTKKSYSSFLKRKKIKREFKTIKIGITAEREIIYNRINERVNRMLDNGLIQEAKKLFPFKNLNALQTVGYRELFSYFNNEINLEFAISEIKKNTRRFAKRQGTWFKKDSEIIWFNYKEQSETIIQYITNKYNL